MNEPSSAKIAMPDTNRSMADKTILSSSSPPASKLLQRSRPTHTSSSESKPHSETSASGPTSWKDLSSSSLTSRNVQISSLYSSMKLPVACLNEHDGCDEAELLARAKRCEEILKLSQQAKEAEAERVRIANIKPLVWAKPTFELDSAKVDTEDTTVTDETQPEDTKGVSLGKRKERQEEEHRLPYHLDSMFSVYPKVRPTEEEVQMLLDFTNQWIPSLKRQFTQSGVEEKKGEDP